MNVHAANEEDTTEEDETTPETIPEYDPWDDIINALLDSVTLRSP